MSTVAVDEHVSVTRLDADPTRVAVMLPGRLYSADRPLLYFATEILQAHGWTVLQVRWTLPGDIVTDEAQTAWVQATTRRVLEMEPGHTRLVVAKSLGCLAAPIATALGIPGLWLTPILSASSVVDALTASTQPSLLVGGTADEAWQSATAEATGKRVLELPGADHSLLVSGDPIASVDVLRTVVSRMSDFVAGLARDQN